MWEALTWGVWGRYWCIQIFNLAVRVLRVRNHRGGLRRRRRDLHGLCGWRYFSGWEFPEWPPWPKVSGTRPVFRLLEIFLSTSRFEKPLSGEEPEWVGIAATSRGERCLARLENAAFARKRHRRTGLSVGNFGSRKSRKAAMILLV
jgi:hypothetical protein